MKGKSVGLSSLNLTVEPTMSVNHSSASLCSDTQEKLPKDNSVGLTMTVAKREAKVVSHSHCRSVKIDCLMLSGMVLLVALQLGLYDTYFVRNGNEQREIYVRRHVRRMLIHEDYSNCSQLSENVTKSENSLKYLYYFIVPDLFAVSAMVRTIYLT